MGRILNYRHISTANRTPWAEKMVREIRRLVRGKCNNCNACYGLVTLSQKSECDFCGCPPSQHVELPSLECGALKRPKKATSLDPLCGQPASEVEAAVEGELSTSDVDVEDLVRDDDDDDSFAFIDVDDESFEDGFCFDRFPPFALDSKALISSTLIFLFFTKLSLLLLITAYLHILIDHY